MANDFTGKNIWFNPPFEAALVRAILRRLHQGRQNSASTNATVILPAYVMALVRDQLDLMPYLTEAHRYPAGTRLFRDPAGTILPTKREVVVLCTDQDNLPDITPSPVCQTCSQSTGTQRNKLLPCSHCGAQSHTECMKVLDDTPICGACSRPGPARATSKPEENQSLLNQLETTVPQDVQYQSWLKLTNQLRMETGNKTKTARRTSFSVHRQVAMESRGRRTSVCGPGQRQCERPAARRTPFFCCSRTLGECKDIRAGNPEILVAWDTSRCNGILQQMHTLPAKQKQSERKARSHAPHPYPRTTIRDHLGRLRNRPTTLLRRT
jgi:hypothetical protein